MVSIINLFEESVLKFSENVFLWQKTSETYVSTTYRQTHEQVYQFAAGLLQLGLKKGDRVALLAEGCNHWVISELGILYNGAINVPLSVKLNEIDEIRFRLKHSGARFVITSKGQLKKIQEAAQTLTIERIIVINTDENFNTSILNFNSVIDLGKQLLRDNESTFIDCRNSVTPNDAANICYTSGTTADPKGIVLTHRNYTANVEQAASLFDIPEWYTTLLILPWDHSFAHTCGIYTVMKFGASLASVKSGATTLETLKNIPINIKEVKPVFLLSVPALAKNFRKNIENGIQDKGKLTINLFQLALKIAYLYNGLGYNKGRGLRILLWPFYRLFDIIIFKKVRAGFGGRLKFFIGGGALLDIELQRFFFAIGMPMYQGYGLSESAPVISSNNFTKYKMGSSGTLVANLELKICDTEGRQLKNTDTGEIVVKGENVMSGYWQNETTTQETLRNGWLHTGDLGYMDNDGYLYVLGRYKSLLIADDGEKFSPEGIEEAFIERSVYIDQCMMYNNQKPYSVCLIYPNKEKLKKYLREHHVPELDWIERSLKKIEEELQRYRKGGELDKLFPQRWLPASIGILSEGFTEENHMMNSTLKIVRPKITNNYSNLLEYLYLPEAKNINNTRNRETLQIMFK